MERKAEVSTTHGADCAGGEPDTFLTPGASAGFCLGGAVGNPYDVAHLLRTHCDDVTSSGSDGRAVVHVFPDCERYVAWFGVATVGDASLHGDLGKLIHRPIHTSVDSAGKHIVVAYNS